jgi:hypothetical protein
MKSQSIEEIQAIARQFRTPQAGSKDTEALLAELLPYLRDLLEAAPAYGSVGLSLAFHDGKIARVESSRSEQRKPGATV